MRMRTYACFIGGFLAVLPLSWYGEAHFQDKPAREPDVIYVPTPQEVVDKMLGDGRRPPRRGRLRPRLRRRAHSGDRGQEVWRPRPGALTSTQCASRNRWKTWRKTTSSTWSPSSCRTSSRLDLSKADVITLYLLPQLNVKLIPQLDKLKPGCRIVSHDFDMEGVRPKHARSPTPRLAAASTASTCGRRRWRRNGRIRPTCQLAARVNMLNMLRAPGTRANRACSLLRQTVAAWRRVGGAARGRVRIRGATGPGNRPRFAQAPHPGHACRDGGEPGPRHP